MNARYLLTKKRFEKQLPRFTGDLIKRNQLTAHTTPITRTRGVPSSWAYFCLLLLWQSRHYGWHLSSQATFSIVVEFCMREENAALMAWTYRHLVTWSLGPDHEPSKKPVDLARSDISKITRCDHVDIHAPVCMYGLHHVNSLPQSWWMTNC